MRLSLVSSATSSGMSSAQAGVVDQRVEHGVDRREQARRGVVAVLELDEIGHLLVETHSRLLGARIVETLGRRLLDVIAIRGGLGVDAELHDRLALDGV